MFKIYYILLYNLDNKIVEYRSRYRHYPFNSHRHIQIIQIHAQKYSQYLELSGSHDMCNSILLNVTTMECFLSIYEGKTVKRVQKSRPLHWNRTISCRLAIMTSLHYVIALRHRITSRNFKTKKTVWFFKHFNLNSITPYRKQLCIP